MKCPHCHVECNALVLETRKQDGAIVRKRVCGPCGRPFYSKEVPDLGLRLRRERPDKIAKRAACIESGPKSISHDAFKTWR